MGWSVRALAERIGLPVANASQRFSIVRRNRLAGVAPDGKRVFCR